MSSEVFSYFRNQWQESIQKSLDNLENVPPELISCGPTYEKNGKKGEEINLATQYYYFKGVNFEPCSPPGDGIRYYLIARDKNGVVVGSRISSIFRTRDKLCVRSRIEVKDRGQGMASLVEDSFIDSLQQLSNTENKKVIWEVKNKNMERLRQHRELNDLDPAIIVQLKKEQERWQYLYGEGGKYNIHHGKRVFTPDLGRDK